MARLAALEGVTGDPHRLRARRYLETGVLGEHETLDHDVRGAGQIEPGRAAQFGPADGPGGDRDGCGRRTGSPHPDHAAGIDAVGDLDPVAGPRLGQYLVQFGAGRDRQQPAPARCLWCGCE